MHLVATNIVIWIQTLFKESLEEIMESAEEEETESDGNIEVRIFIYYKVMEL